MEPTGQNTTVVGTPLTKAEYLGPGAPIGGTPRKPIAAELIHEAQVMVGIALKEHNRAKAVAAIDRAFTMDDSPAHETHIASLNLPQRITQLLERHDIHSVEELRALSDEQLRGIPMLGVKMLVEIREKLG